MKDEEIIQHFRHGNHDAPIKVLYKEFPKLRAHILASKGSKAEAQETFHDALILIIEKVSDPSFTLTSKLTTYLYGITRLLWKNKLRKQQKSNELEWSDTIILTNEDIGYHEDQESKIRALEGVLGSITKRCQEIFRRFYFEKESMDEIANAMGFSSTNSAKTQKYKCMEQAIRLGSNVNLPNS
jgi:RNA polymerase sigma factor (sigma-70 family)